MTDEQIAAIREALDPVLGAVQGDMGTLCRLVPVLIDENAAMREIVRAVAPHIDRIWAGFTIETRQIYCRWCTSHAARVAGVLHTDDCPVTKARALVQQWVAADYERDH